jgi:hypothetical protein
MPEKAAGSGGYQLEVPIDVSAVSADDRKQQTLKVVVRTCDGELLSAPVKFRADGSGSATFAFATRPESLRVFVGPDRAEDQELVESQTLSNVVPKSMFEGRRLVLEPIVVSYWWWSWWWRWCREFTIHGRVVCPDGRPVVGAEVCAYDVDWFWWWWTKQQVGCSFTDVNGSFDISFRWCCGFWPWWWWRYRAWEFQPELAQAIVPILERDPRIQLGDVTNVPSLDVFKPLLGRELDTSKPLASMPAGQLEQVRSSLLERLPQSPELAQLRIWPWWPWWPWWDCTPDIIFKVTQDCRFPGAVILDEGYAATRWDIPDPLNVTLVANDLACCKPIPPCVEGDCIDISAFCSDEFLAIDDVGGNLGAPVGRPDGYAPGDRPFTQTVAVLKANTFVGVDYYEIEFWDTGLGAWGPVPAGACEDFCRHWLQPLFPFPSGNVAFKWGIRNDASSHPHLVVESREHYESVSPLLPAAFWAISSQLVVPLNSTVFADGTYRFRVVGWQDAGGGKLKNGHVLKWCDTENDNQWVLTFDNRVYPDPSVLNCGGSTVRLCTKEPKATLNNITIDGNPIPACGVSDIKGDLVIDFEASDVDGHLESYSLGIDWGAGLHADLLTLPGATLTRVTGDGEGPTYAAALGQPWGAAVPTWHGGTMRLSVPASEAFPDPCCYLIRLEAVKRHVLGSAFGACGYTCNYDQYYNIDEFTVGAGVCDPPRKVGVASMPVPEAG